MNFLNKIFASSHNKGSFQIEDVSGSEEDQDDEIPEHQEIPQFKKQSIQQLSSYNSRKKPQPKMGQADFLARYDENFDDVFGDKPTPIDCPKGRKRRQEEEEDDENDNERKSQKKKTQSKERKQQSKDQKDNKKKEYREIIDYKELNDNKEQLKEQLKEPLEPKILKEPKIRLPKFPKQRKRIANNHLSTLRSNSDGRDSISNKDRESIQQNNKYNPNEIALPQTALLKSEKKQDKQKTMFFQFGINDNDNDNDNKEIKNTINHLFYDQKEKIDKNEQQSNNQKEQEIKNEKKDRNEKKQRKDKKDKEKKIFNHLNIFDEIKDIQQKNVNSKQNSEQRETRKLNSEQREKKRDKKRVPKQSREKNIKLTSKSPSPELKLIQYETQKRVKRNQKRIVQDLEMLNVDELSLNPNIVECKPNLYLDYIPVYD